MANTSPDDIWYPTTPDAYDYVSNLSQLASSVQDALNSRQRHDYVWANQAARVAQTGAVQGDRGYQTDTKTEYIFDNNTWRLALPHVEYTASQSIPSAGGAPTLAGVFTMDTSKTTSSTFTSASGSGGIIINSPGLYAISTLTFLGSSLATTGRSFIDLAGTSSGDTQLLMRVSINESEGYGAISLPNYRTTASNTAIYFRVYQTSTSGARTATTRVRITRIA